MRNLKFRVWDNTPKHEGGQCMIPWEQLVRLDYEQELSIRDILTGAGNIERNYFPMQYTGLKDKAGTEIYEGDIVKYKTRSYGGFYDEDVIVIGEVMFNYSQWRVERRLATPDNRMTPELDFHYNAKYIEVIGNIKENPELLEAKDAH